MTIVFVLICTVCFSQEFTYKKIQSQGHTLKMKGKIIVNDSIITIYTNNMPASFNVNKTVDVNSVKQYKVVGAGEGTEIRITLNNPEKPTKLAPKTLLMETKSSFSTTISNLLYYLD